MSGAECGQWSGKLVVVCYVSEKHLLERVDGRREKQSEHLNESVLKTGEYIVLEVTEKTYFKNVGSNQTYWGSVHESQVNSALPLSNHTGRIFLLIFCQGMYCKCHRTGGQCVKIQIRSLLIITSLTKARNDSFNIFQNRHLIIFFYTKWLQLWLR